jgi:hypothetical protein
MRRYHIVSGILLILSIIDFALAAPVLVQQKRQAGVAAVHMPKDVITVLGKRLDEEELAELLKTWGKPVDSSDSHASSSSAPSSSAQPGPDHGSTNVVQSPEPNPASSTANPGLLTEPSSPSSTVAIPDSFQDRFNAAWDNRKSDKGSVTSMEPLFTPGPSEYGSDDDLEWATAHLPSLKLSPSRILEPSPDADANFDWHYWSTAPSPPKPSLPNSFGGFGHVQQSDAGPSTRPDPIHNWYEPASSNEFGLPPEHQVGNPWAQPSAGADPNFDWDHWMSLDDPLTPSPKSGSAKETYPGSPKEPENEVAPGKSPTPESTDPELNSDHQSSSTDSQLADSQAAAQAAALYAAKGKAKQMRRISGTARDVGNVAQRGVAAY